MKIVFMGTPYFAALILDELATQHDVVAVYTRPDAVRGRGATLAPSPVKEVAIKSHIDVYTPSTLKDEAVWNHLRALNPDVIVVAAYGAILPLEVLNIPRCGCINVHASLLPRWRGAAPIERAILAGDKEIGVCIMQMEEGLDTGPYCVYRCAHIDQKTSDEITDELANLGCASLLTALSHIEQDAVHWVYQDDEEATYAHKLEKGELDISLMDTVSKAARKIQASSVAHPSKCVIAGRPVALIRAINPFVKVIKGTSVQVPNESLSRDLEGMLPGQVRFVQKRLFLGVAEGPLEILEVRPDGKNLMDAKSFAAGIQDIKSGSLIWQPLPYGAR